MRPRVLYMATLYCAALDAGQAALPFNTSEWALLVVKDGDLDRRRRAENRSAGR